MPERSSAFPLRLQIAGVHAARLAGGGSAVAYNSLDVDLTPHATQRTTVGIAVAMLCALWWPAAARGAELQPPASAAFDRYVRATETRIAAEVARRDQFIWPLTRPAAERDARLDALRKGALVVEALTSTERGGAIDVPDGLVHHWLGIVFLPGVPLDRAVALLQDYDAHGSVYAPRIARAQLRSRTNDTFAFHLRFFMKKVITVVIDSEHEARFTRAGPDRVYSRIESTRMNEVEAPGTSDEHQKPVGQDGGYLWRLNSYWRFLERDGGTYIQCESISLTRDIPFGLGWLVQPFVTSLPRESLEFTLEATRRALRP